MNHMELSKNKIQYEKITNIIATSYLPYPTKFLLERELYIAKCLFVWYSGIIGCLYLIAFVFSTFPSQLWVTDSELVLLSLMMKKEENINLSATLILTVVLTLLSSTTSPSFLLIMMTMMMVSFTSRKYQCELSRDLWMHFIHQPNWFTWKQFKGYYYYDWKENFCWILLIISWCLLLCILHECIYFTKSTGKLKHTPENIKSTKLLEAWPEDAKNEGGRV